MMKLNIALLTDNYQELKELSSFFRQHQLMIEAYNELSEIPLSDLKERTILIASEKKWLQYPVLAELQQTTFYISENKTTNMTLPLEFSPFYLQNKVASYKQILHERKRYLRLKEERYQYEERIALHRERIQTLEEKNKIFELSEKLKNNFFDLHEQITSLKIIPEITPFTQSTLNHFEIKADLVIYEWDDTNQFYHLKKTNNQNIEDFLKYEEFPLVSSKLELITQKRAFANNINEKLINQFGHHLNFLEITGPYNFPALLCFFISTKDSLLHKENFINDFEILLNFYYTRYLFDKSKDSRKQDEREVHLWDSISFIDSYLKKENGLQDKKVGLLIDFDNLFQGYAASSSTVRWNILKEELIDLILQHLPEKTKMTTLNYFQWLIFIDEKDLSSSLQSIKKILYQYPYWDYFEGKKEATSYNLTPKIYAFSLEKMNNTHHIIEKIMNRSITYKQNINKIIDVPLNEKEMRI